MVFGVGTWFCAPNKKELRVKGIWRPRAVLVALRNSQRQGDRKIWKFPVYSLERGTYVVQVHVARGSPRAPVLLARALVTSLCIKFT